MSFGTITITNAATRILVGNTERISVILVNEGPGSAWIGSDNTVTAGTGTNSGIEVVDNGTISEDSGGTRMYLGDFWAINDTNVASAISFWERTRKI